MKAYQDVDMAYQYLSRPSQINCIMDDQAKNVIWVLEGLHLPIQDNFPLEPVLIFVGNEKMTFNTGDSLLFWVHQQLAKKIFFKLVILTPLGFKEVVWMLVYDTLHEVLQLFQLWAYKQVINIAGKNLIQSGYKPYHYTTCPSCDQCVETCAHVLSCNEAVWVNALYQSINILDKCLNKIGTHTHLCKYILQYAKGREGISMTYVLHGTGRRYIKLAASQDLVGWRRFMEGMIYKEMLVIQQEYLDLRGVRGTPTTPTSWNKFLIVCLIEITHGQWLYQNMHVHDTVTGFHATLRKEELQKEIEYQIQLGGEGLAEGDKYLLEINLEDMESTSEEGQE